MHPNTNGMAEELTVSKNTLFSENVSNVEMKTH